MECCRNLIEVCSDIYFIEAELHYTSGSETRGRDFFAGRQILKIRKNSHKLNIEF